MIELSASRLKLIASPLERLNANVEHLAKHLSLPRPFRRIGESRPLKRWGTAPPLPLCLGNQSCSFQHLHDARYRLAMPRLRD
jgi:hypothetical protein